MKYLKTYESSYFTFEDDKLIVHKIKHGENMGKIFFRFYSEESKLFDDKSSLMYGCYQILNTKYENEPIIRNIELGTLKFRKVQTNTIGAILNKMLLDIGYDKITVDNIKKRLPFLKLIPDIHNKIKELSLNSKNLGDVLDGLREIEIYIFDIQKEHYKKWHKNKMITKYNI